MSAKAKKQNANKRILGGCRAMKRLHSYEDLLVEIHFFLNTKPPQEQIKSCADSIKIEMGKNFDNTLMRWNLAALKMRKGPRK